MALTIERNELLPNCTVIVVCEHLTMGRPHEIKYNAMGCNTTDEVQSSCNYVGF